ncbi:MAG: hypothetical protein JXA62_03525 [Candidatus Aminicenantes bacterium]|nr:hypothetical protein [Candidatus Aminicenantes bacterium]
MKGDLNSSEIRSLSRILESRGVVISEDKIARRMNLIAESQHVFPLERQRALLLQLISMYEESRKKAVILIEEIGESRLPVTFAIGALAEDWPGMSNSILGIVHQAARNVDFLKGFTVDYESMTVGLVILAFTLTRPDEYEHFLREKEKLVRRIRMAAVGSAGKSLLLDDETVKFGIYNEIVRRIRRIYHEPDVNKLIGEKGEALYFVSSRSREYLEERSVRMLADLIIDNHRFQEALRKGEVEQVIRIRNFQTRFEHLTGITFVCREELVSVEDFLHTLNFMVPGYILKHHKSFVNEQGVLVYRLEIVDRYGNPLKGAQIQHLEESLMKLVNTAFSKPFSRVKSIGGFEHYARAIIPFLMLELKRTHMTQVLMSVENQSDFSITIKLVVVARDEDPGRLHLLLTALETLPGVEVISSLPPKRYTEEVEVAILKLRVEFTEFSNVREVFDVLKKRIESVYGTFRDFDQGFREIDLRVLGELYDTLKSINQLLVRDIFFSFDELYRIEAPFDLLVEAVKLCAKAVDQANRAGGQKLIFRYRILHQLKRTVLVVSSQDQRDLLPRMVKHLESIPFSFSRIEWNQRSYHILVLKHEPVFPNSSWLRRLREFLKSGNGLKN